MQTLQTLIEAKPETYGGLGLARGELAALTGTMRDETDDFEVEEIPAYEPCGVGEHLFLKIEKRGVSAFGLRQRLQDAFELSDHEIGTAGMKDQAAVTRQWVSVPARCEPHVALLDGDGLRVLAATRHGNKLRTGHLRGNRFTILVRGLTADDQVGAEAIAARIASHGVANFYGPQRFGAKGDTAAIGRALLEGRRNEVPRRFLERKQRTFALSALQSQVFNHVLMRRLEQWPTSTVLAGDLMVKVNGAMFVAQDVAVETERFARREIVPTGPMFGNDVMAPTGDALAFEEAAIATMAIGRQYVVKWGKGLPGARRALFIYPDNLTITTEAAGLRFSFGLPPGAYATVVMASFLTHVQ